MKIVLNGREQQVADISNLQQLVDAFNRSQLRVIAELNGTILKSNEWNDAPIREGDTVELVTFVGGG